MIDKLEIKNYGSNKKIDIEFSPTVTTIVGKSYEGKSWILRALRWVVRNKPSGQSFINWDAEKASVRLTTNNSRITRTKGKSVNSYKLIKKDWKKSKEYAAFGNDVPPEIVETINLSDINFQGINTLGQHEPPFLLCETAGEVSRQLNSIINLDIIDKTLANLASEIRYSKITVDICKKSLDKAKEDSEKLKYVKQLDEDLRDIESLEKQYQKNTRKSLLIDKLIESAIKYKISYKNAAEQASGAKIILSMAKLCREKAKSIEILRNLIKSGQNTQKILSIEIKPLKELNESVNNLEKKKDTLSNLIIIVNQRRGVLCETEGLLKESTKNLKQIMKGKCPICGSNMKT